MAAYFTSIGNVRVVVYDTRLNAMATRYTMREANQAQAFAKAFAPVRTGRLKRSIRIDVARLAGDMKVVRIEARARSINTYGEATHYSVYVHEGTTGPIYSANGDYLWVPKRKYGTHRMKRASVRGQAPNPFLERGLEAAISGKGLIGGRFY